MNNVFFKNYSDIELDIQPSNNYLEYELIGKDQILVTEKFKTKLFRVNVKPMA